MDASAVPITHYSLELDLLIHHPALRAAGEFHVRIVGVNEGALAAAENVVTAPLRLKAFATKLVIDRHARQRRQQQHQVAEEQLVRAHREAPFTARATF